MTNAPLRVGHVVFNVSDVTRSMEFYTEVVGLQVAARRDGAAFLTCGTQHHDIALFQAPAGATARAGEPAIGLNHVALQLPDRAALRSRYDLLCERGIPVRTTEHNVTLSVYFQDPDGNRIELFCDRYANGLEVMQTKGPMARPMDIAQLETI
jgi:catechol-2,3-dioxygenase